MIRTKSVYTIIDEATDGLRILATRGRGRGLPSNRFDVWMANLGPSEELLGQMRSGEISWEEFVRQYKAELFDTTGGVDYHNSKIKNHGQKFTLRLLQELGRRGNVTLLCHCTEEQQHCHRHVLQAVLRSKI